MFGSPNNVVLLNSVTCFTMFGSTNNVVLLNSVTCFTMFGSPNNEVLELSYVIKMSPGNYQKLARNFYFISGSIRYQRSGAVKETPPIGFCDSIHTFRSPMYSVEWVSGERASWFE